MKNEEKIKSHPQSMYLHENATTSNVAGLKTVKRLPLGTRRTWSRSSTSRIKRLFTKSSSSLKSTRSPSIRIQVYSSRRPSCYIPRRPQLPKSSGKKPEFLEDKATTEKPPEYYFEEQIERPLP